MKEQENKSVTNPKSNYAPDKPKNCQACYYWNGSKNGCELGEENCYYLLPPKQHKKKKSPCEGCPYGRVNPCIGYCMRNLLKGKRQAGDQ